MSSVVITIETDSAAFQNIGGRTDLVAGGRYEWPEGGTIFPISQEIARILRRMADEFERYGLAFDPRDINGNVVGTVEVKGGG